MDWWLATMSTVVRTNGDAVCGGEVGSRVSLLYLYVNFPEFTTANLGQIDNMPESPKYTTSSCPGQPWKIKPCELDGGDFVLC